MKKTILMIMVCLMTTATNSLAESTYTGKVFLQHKGNITQTFNGDEISNAIEAAVDGDTLFLSKGLFKSGFTINKSISLIGSGAEAGSNETKSTYLEWSGNSPQIKADDNKTLSSVTIEGVFSGMGFYVYGNIENVTFKKCYFPNFLDLNSTIKTAVIDRCRLSYLYLNSSIEDLKVKNCKIQTVSGNRAQNNSACQFINCNISQVNTNTKATFVNSIINQVGNGTSDFLGTNAMLINTLYHKMNGYDPMEQTPQQDCWSTTETLISSYNDYKCTKTSEELKTAGYLGIDDTVVGVEGGVNPYSLTIHAPSINSKSANIDLTNKKVTINVNVTAN